jgi:hypothetical protein
MKKNLFYLLLIMICTCAFLLYLLIYQLGLDNQAPTIYFSDEELEFSVLDSREMFLKGVTAQDNVDGDVTDSVVVAGIQLADGDGTIEVTYAAFDAAGNATTAVRKAKFTDYEPPRFSLNRSMTFTSNSEFNIFHMVQAEDMLDGDISHRIRITSLDEALVTTIGTHQLELKVSNSLGETVRLVIPVEVYVDGTYDAALSLTDYLVYLPAGGELNAESYLDAYIRGGRVSLQEGLPEGYTLEMKNNVQPDVPGVYTVEYRVTQTVGAGTNTRNYTGYAKLIVVVEG